MIFFEVTRVQRVETSTIWFFKKGQLFFRKTIDRLYLLIWQGQNPFGFLRKVNYFFVKR